MKKLFFLILFSSFKAGLFAQYDPKALEILEAMAKKYRVGFSQQVLWNF